MTILTEAHKDASARARAAIAAIDAILSTRPERAEARRLADRKAALLSARSTIPLYA